MSHRILIVGKDAERRDALESGFREQGFDVAAAATAPEGMGLAATLRPDVVVTWHGGAGGTGGLDLLAGVSARLPEVPVVVITAADDAHAAAGALRAGAYEVLAEPVDPVRLALVVARRLGPPAGITWLGVVGMNELSSEVDTTPHLTGVRWLENADRPVLELELAGMRWVWDNVDPHHYVIHWTPGESGHSRVKDLSPDEVYLHAAPASTLWSAGDRHQATVTEAGVTLVERATGARVEIAEPGLEDVALSHDGRLLLALQGTAVRIWRCDTGVEVARLPDAGGFLLCVARNAPVFATCGSEVRAWSYDTALLMEQAGPSHPFEVFSRGAGPWNAWRERYPSVAPRLGAVNSSLRDLSAINLRGAGLARAVLRRAALRDADLRGADLRFSDLRDADLRRARLAGADLSEALVAGALLDGADLSGATLFRTDLTGAELGGADLSGAVAGWTVFGSNDLSTTRGLDRVRHERPSVLGLDTLRTLAAAPPLEFLRGCGLSDAVIRALPQLLAAGAHVEFYSCFISYAHEDRAFATRLHDRLQALGILCWLDEHQLLVGDDVYDSVANGIRRWDKVLLCASRASLTSWWVDNEIGMVLEKEERLSRERGARIQALIPLNLDGYLFSDEWRDGKAALIRRRLAADFTEWQTDERFDEQLRRVVEALRLEPHARAAPPTPRI